MRTTQSSLKRQRSTSKKAKNNNTASRAKSSSKLLSKAEDRAALQQNREILSENMQAKLDELTEYTFNRIKHPRLEMITEDSLRKCLIDYEVSIAGGAYEAEDKDGLTESDRVIREMLRMAVKAGKD